MEADEYDVSYKPRKGERIEGKLGIVLIPLRNMALFLFLDSLLQNICVTKKGLCFVSLMFIPKLVSYFILRNPKLRIVESFQKRIIYVCTKVKTWHSIDYR